MGKQSPRVHISKGLKHCVSLIQPCYKQTMFPNNHISVEKGTYFVYLILIKLKHTKF